MSIVDAVLEEMEAHRSNRVGKKTGLSACIDPTEGSLRQCHPLF